MEFWLVCPSPCLCHSQTDEMGLGKTIQTIAFLAHLWSRTMAGAHYLIVAPLSTLSNWVNEFKKYKEFPPDLTLRWVPDIPVIMYHGTKAEREQIQSDYPKTKGQRQSAGFSHDPPSHSPGRPKKKAPQKKARTTKEPDQPLVYPVFVTSYEVAINDKAYLGGFKVQSHQPHLFF